jgi:hypothetical protein
MVRKELLELLTKECNILRDDTVIDQLSGHVARMKQTGRNFPHFIKS